MLSVLKKVCAFGLLLPYQWCHKLLAHWPCSAGYRVPLKGLSPSAAVQPAAGTLTSKGYRFSSTSLNYRQHTRLPAASDMTTYLARASSNWCQRGSHCMTRLVRCGLQSWSDSWRAERSSESSACESFATNCNSCIHVRRYFSLQMLGTHLRNDRAAPEQPQTSSVSFCR